MKRIFTRKLKMRIVLVVLLAVVEFVAVIFGLLIGITLRSLV